MNSRTPFVPSARLLRHFQRNLSGITRPQQCTQSLRHQPVRTRLASKGQQVRHASASPNTSEWFRDVKNLWDHQMRENPILFPVALITTAISLTALVYATYLHAKVRMEMGNYPESVGLKLRRAIYFTDHDLDPAQAAKAYVGALKAAQEEKMHPLSEEVLGIWLTMAHFLEKVGNYREAIDVYDNVRKDALKWIELHGQVEGNAGDRGRLLQKTIQLANKTAELYSLPQVANAEKVEENLTWAVTTTLRENQRRAKEGLKAGEETFYDLDQQGAQIEALGQHFEAKDNHYFASQLFLQALMIKPTQDCHSVILMNNLAASIAQSAPPTEPGTRPPTPQQMRDSGKAWAVKALELARKISPPLRTAECDQGCAVATHNLGEFAEMAGQWKEARELYEEAHSLAHAIAFEDGMSAAEEGLKRISKK